MANDTLTVELIILDDRADAKLKKFEGNLVKTGKTADDIGKNSSFGKNIISQFSQVEDKSENLRKKLNDVGAAFGLAVGGAAAVGIAVKVLKDSVGAAFEAERANRQLSASATQAGLAYQFLAQKAKEFADEGGLSQTGANRTEGLIAKLAQASGRPQDLDKIETALLDTASARGIQISQLETLVNAVISGSSDEPLNAVGLSDPGKLAKDYADKLGKSTDALTKQEQVLSRLIPLLQQAETVTGANADRMKSLSGQAETAAAQIEDLQTNFGKSITNTLEFRDALGLLNGVLKEITANPYEISIKLKQGNTPRQLAEQEADKTGNKIIDFAKTALSFPLANPAYVADLITDGFETANNRYIDLLTGAKARRIKELTELFEGENDLIQKQNQAAEKQKTFLNLQTFEDQEKSRSEQQKKDIEMRRKSFDSRFSNVSGLDDINQNRQLLKELNQNRDLFSPEEFAKRVYETQQKITSDIDRGKEIIKQFEKQYLSTFDTLAQKTNANNPVFNAFNEGDKALKDLKENLRGLPGEVQTVAVEMQKKLNFRAQFAALLENKLSVIGLNQEAANFRNPFDGEKQKKEQDEFVARFLRNNPNYLFLNNKNALDEEARSKILKQFAPSGLVETPADRINKNFDDKFNALYNLRQTPEQKAIADKSFIALTNGSNPLDLSSANRERAAEAREREAVRQERYQQDALSLYREQRDYQKKIAENTDLQNKIAETGGTKAVELTVKDDRTNGGTIELKPAATGSDTANAYQGNLSFYEQNEIQAITRR